MLHGLTPKQMVELLPGTVRRAGKFLLQVMRTDYEKRNAPIADLDLCEANPLLKEQLAKYYRSEPPFDRALRANEGPREWWAVLNKKKDRYSQPLAVR